MDPDAVLSNVSVIHPTSDPDLSADASQIQKMNIIDNPPNNSNTNPTGHEAISSCSKDGDDNGTSFTSSEDHAILEMSTNNNDLPQISSRIQFADPDTQ